MGIYIERERERERESISYLIFMKYSENLVIVNETWDFWAPGLTKSIVIKPVLDVSSVY